MSQLQQAQKDVKIDVKYDASANSIVRPKKLLILHGLALSDEELTALDDIGAVCHFNKKSHAMKTYKDLLSLYDVLLIDIDDKDCFAWYAGYSAVIKADQSIRVVLLHPKNVSIAEELKAKTSTYGIDNILKNIPSQYNDKNDLIDKLMADHLPKLDLPVAEGCLKLIFHAVKSKICGGDN